MRIIIPLSSALFALSACGDGDAASSSANRLVGTVRNAYGLNGIAGADVLVTDSTGAPVGAAIADSLGGFVLPVPAGQYRVRARQIGFTEAESPMITVAANTLETRVEVELEPFALPMTSLMVTTSDGGSGRTEFARRRTLGEGVFLTEDSIAARRPATVADAFRGIPGIKVEDGTVNQSFVVRAVSGPSCLAVFVDTNPFPYSFTATDGRTPPRLAASGDADINKLYRARELRAIEIYHDWAAAPAELKESGRITDVSPCGVAVIWTQAAW